MKKFSLLAVVLCLVISSFAGCQFYDKQYENDDNTVGNVVIGNVLDTNNELLLSDMNAVIIYSTFEDLLPYVTDIVIATYVGRSSGSNFIATAHEFYIEERLMGEDTENKIKVYSYNMNDNVIGYDKITYREGEKYILLLQRIVSVYHKDCCDKYYVVGNLYFPLKDLSLSTLYGENILKHSNLTRELMTEEKLKKYILEKTKGNTKLYYGKDYIRSSKIEDIISGSSYILQVEIGEKFIEGFSKDRITYKCNVLKTIKGDLIEENESVFITFMYNTVKQGEILALLG